MLLFTIGSTLLYFQRLAIVADAFTDQGARVRFFARVDLAVNLLTLVTQAWGMFGGVPKARERTGDHVRSA